MKNTDTTHSEAKIKSAISNLVKDLLFHQYYVAVFKGRALPIEPRKSIRAVKSELSYSIHTSLGVRTDSEKRQIKKKVLAMYQSGELEIVPITDCHTTKQQIDTKKEKQIDTILGG